MIKSETATLTSALRPTRQALLFVGTILIMGLLLFEQQPTARAANDDAAEKRELITRMLILTDGFKIGLDSVSKMPFPNKDKLEKVAPGKSEEIIQIIKDETVTALQSMQFEIENEVIKLYAAHFTVEELRAMLAFYITPAGVKSLRFFPVVMQNAQKIGIKYAKKAKAIAGPRINRRLREIRPSRSSG